MEWHGWQPLIRRRCTRYATSSMPLCADARSSSAASPVVISAYSMPMRSGGCSISAAGTTVSRMCGAVRSAPRVAHGRVGRSDSPGWSSSMRTKRETNCRCRRSMNGRLCSDASANREGRLERVAAPRPLIGHSARPMNILKPAAHATANNARSRQFPKLSRALNRASISAVKVAPKKAGRRTRSAANLAVFLSQYARSRRLAQVILSVDGCSERSGDPY